MSDYVENPFRPTSGKNAMLIAAGISALIFGWWAFENLTDYRLATLKEQLGGIPPLQSELSPPVALWVPLGFAPLCLLAAVVLRYREGLLAREGQLITATVLKARTVKGVRIVTIQYSLYGRTRTRKFDIYGLWAEKLDAPEEVEILVTPGFFGMVHVLGRIRIHDLRRAEVTQAAQGGR
jgi:hypothetical protein